MCDMLDLRKLKRLVEDREAEGVTRGDMARRAGMTPQRFWNVINGKVPEGRDPTDVKLSTLYGLARATGVKPHELLK